MDFKCIDLSSISTLECLEKLEFDNCEGFTYEHCKAFSKKKFQLKELKLWHDDLDDIYNVDNIYDHLGINLNVIVGIINSLGSETLTKLSFNIITTETINEVKKCFPKIIFLHIRMVSPNYLNLIIPIICDLSLKILHIQMDSYEENSSNLLVEILGDNLKSVEYLYLDVMICSSSFKYFTSNCKVDLKKWIIPYNESLRKDYLTCVNNYQKVHKSLKLLGIDENEDGFCWDNDELEIIDSLKSQGIDIVPSNQLLKLFY
jgi:hypothetical protein